MGERIQKPKLDGDEQCPLVILMHGLRGTKNSHMIELLANILAEKGIASIRFDFNGCGESEGKFEDMTVESEIGDEKARYKYERQWDYVDRISLLGHSQGGGVAAMVAGELRKDKGSSLVLMAPAVILKHQAQKGDIRGFIFDPHNIPDKLAIEDGLFLGKEYIEVAQTLPIIEVAKQYEGEVCVIQGDDDVVELPKYTDELCKHYKYCQMNNIVGEGHMFAEDMGTPVDISIEFLFATLV